MIKNYLNSDATVFFERINNDENRDWVWRFITIIRERFPNSDHYTTGAEDKSYIDIRIGKKDPSKKTNGSPVFYFQLESGARPFCFLHENIQTAAENYKNASCVEQKTDAAINAWLDKFEAVILSEKQKHLDGGSFNPIDFKLPDSGSDAPYDNEKIADSTNLLQVSNLNQILFGPPGTGKTYATIDESLKILDPDFYQNHTDDRSSLKKRFDALVSEGLVRFITFHQSFSYEDFVEGLRADTDDQGALRYEIVDGIFKTICDSAAVKVTQQTDAPMELNGRRIWKMSLGDSQNGEAYIYDECIEHGYVLHGFGNGIDFTDCQNADSVRKLIADTGEELGKFDYGITAVNIFKNKVKIGDLIVVTDGNLRFRAIGEVTGEYKFLDRETQGDTFSQCRPVRWLRVYSPSAPMEQLMNNRFSQMTIYELRPGSIDTEKLIGLLGGSASINTVTEIGSIPFRSGEKFGTDYVVLHASADILELKKPKGKTFGLSMRLLNELATEVRSGKISIEDIRDKKVFDKIPNTTVEPFLVNGYSNILPSLVAKIIEKGSPPNATGASQSASARVLIIDEINRGNISRIFGELITLIEPSKRAGAKEALSVTLPYSKKPFSVPSNVYLIGTMNTADRSLAGLDIALRRRFTFKEMPPKPEVLEGIDVEGINIASLLRTMNERIEVLLDRDHCLGHAYFMPLKQAEKKNLIQLKSIFSQQILPLLKEYFFEDWERIAWVLNDQNKSDDNHKFILKASSNLNDLFGNKVASSLQNIDQRWYLNQNAFEDINSYRLILGANQ